MHRSLVAATVAASLGLGALLAACGSDGGGPEVKLSAAGEQGKQVAKEQGCISCHTADGGKGTGPTWQGLAGSTVTLEDGTEVTADDAYLRQAILQSRGQVVKGYANVMPVYDGELSDAEVDALIAYLHDLAPAGAEGGSEGSGS
ncbi:MAG TPA: cytochrome c [Acidimicrobiales bacterium]|nr:cytochrome c [Acidimicrobiales bacterium]